MRQSRGVSEMIRLSIITGILAGGILSAQEVELSITDINFNENNFTVSIANTMDVYAFTLTVEGVEITDVYFYQDPWFWMIQGGDMEDGIITAYTFDTPPIPPGEWTLIDVTFEPTADTEVCLVDAGFQWLDGWPWQYVNQDTACCAWFDFPQDIVFGDLNEDGALNVLDIILLVEQILSQEEPTLFQLNIADLNGDNDLDVLDIVMMVEIILEGSEG